MSFPRRLYYVATRSRIGGMGVTVQRLIWDEWNVSHIAGHEVTPDEVEQVCHGAFVVLQGYAGRLLLLGPTVEGRMLVAVLEPVADGVFYIVTARPASRKERRYYIEQKGVDSE